MKFMLNEQELDEHLTKEMVAPTEAQPLRDHTAYQKWNQKDCSARYTLLSSLQNDLIGQYDELPTCLKFSFGGTSTMRLRSLVIKFEEYTKDPKNTMSEHLTMMSNMIGKLRDARHALTDEQQVRAVIRSLPASWANMKQILTHSENIKNFSDVSYISWLRLETLTRFLLMSPKRDCAMQMASVEDKMKDMGEANYVLGVKIVRDRSKRLLGGAISWCSKKKSCIALSTMESEYVACSAAVQEAVWLRSFIHALGVTAHKYEAVAVHCENTAALDFVKDPKYHEKAKHIGLRYHFIKTLVAQGEVSMKHIPTGRMMADLLTKPIARDPHFSFLFHLFYPILNLATGLPHHSTNSNTVPNWQPTTIDGGTVSPTKPSTDMSTFYVILNLTAAPPSQHPPTATQSITGETKTLDKENIFQDPFMKDKKDTHHLLLFKQWFATELRRREPYDLASAMCAKDGGDGRSKSGSPKATDDERSGDEGRQRHHKEKKKHEGSRKQGDTRDHKARVGPRGRCFYYAGPHYRRDCLHKGKMIAFLEKHKGNNGDSSSSDGKARMGALQMI
ncbi:hypothetical protein RJ640_005283 [Escallonia rubra]|uniref:Uncharacterized protein n=1 Tax=Escallonia rubra TaxID=112253 RepID=A0AA88QLQ3_9ASTE|nr:hypothetical protein RJ640_005283 [Escallonia rubra]